MIPLQTASPHPVSHVVFSPDGAAIAVAQPHSGVTLIERGTGRTLAACAMPRRAFLSGLAFCGGGKYLAAAHAKGVEVFDAATGALVWQNFHYPQKFQLAVRGDTVFGSPPRNYTLLRPMFCATDAGLAEPVGTRGLHRSKSEFVACAPDASRLLSAEGNRLLVIDAATERVVAEVERGRVESPAPRVAKFGPAGRRFAVNDGRTLDVYDADECGEEVDEPAEAGEGEPPVAPMPHVVLDPVFSLAPDKPEDSGEWYPPFALLADGRGLLVKRPRNRVQWWDAPSRSLRNEWSWRLEWVTCVAASPDGLTAVAGGRFGRVLLWDLE